MYLEAKCLDKECEVYNLKVYIYLGTNITLDFNSQLDLCYCKLCHGQMSRAINVGFAQSKLSIIACETNGVMHEKIYMTNKYKVLEEMKFFEWDWIQLRSATLTEYELSLLSTLCRDDFNIHHSIYKRRKIEFHDSTKTEKSTMTQAEALDKEVQTQEMNVKLEFLQASIETIQERDREISLVTRKARRMDLKIKRRQQEL